MPRKAASRKPAAAAAPGSVSLQAPPDFNIVQVSSLHADWLQRLIDAAEAPQAWVLDVSAVQEFDTAALQLLLALKHGLARQGQTLSLQSPSAVVQASLQTYGLSTALEPLAFAD
ncbi:STAS domain-containing protein [Roseateles sp.]|uniref:STAS domain-containing protein n=1 Tax=Roseateles sp. TaxID=1971397 RepID=UPI003925B34C